MSEYKLKTGELSKKVLEKYDNTEAKFKEKFLEEDEKMESGYRLKTGKTGENVVNAYKKVEDTVVNGYKQIEKTVVGGYKKIEQGFIDRFLEEIDEEK